MLKPLTFGLALLNLSLVLLVVIFPGHLGLALPALLACAAAAAAGWRWTQSLETRQHFLEGALDAVPQPLTVTDLNMRWVFVNKTTESLLKKTRAQVLGRHCSEWRAHICNTDKCGINSLRGGRPRTHYMQDMGDGSFRAMQVDTSYITGGKGQRIGHIEIVTDVHAQRELEDWRTKLASSLEEMTSTMTELDAQTRANAEGAASGSKMARETRETIQLQAGQMAELNQAMTAITDSSRQITRINKTIDEIAFQTNLLALNAAVEAARAGESGAGFAVVADEVRSLASRATEAARQTSTLIESSVSAVERGGTSVARMADSLSVIESKADSVNSIAEQIARASTEQVEGISSVTQAIAHLGRSALDPSRAARAAELVRIE